MPLSLRLLGYRGNREEFAEMKLKSPIAGKKPAALLY
jgi:hypothetical protein